MTKIFTKKNTTHFYRESFFLNTSFISALMVVVNLLSFSSVHFCFVYLRFQRICLWLISALKKERKHEWIVLSFFLVLFVLNLIAFVYNRLKQSLILQTKPNRFLQTSLHRVLMFILKKHLALYVETWVRICCYVRHLCLHLLFCFVNLH